MSQRNKVIIGRVKGSMIYTGVNPESIQNPLDNDLYFHTQEYKFYCYNDGSWNEVSDLREYVIDTLNKDLEDKEVLKKIRDNQLEITAINNHLKASESSFNNRITMVENVKADMQYVDYADEEISRRIDQNDLYISANTQNVSRLIEHVTSINNSITSLTNRVGDVEKEKADTQYVNEKFNQILGEGATETLDTISEISKALEEHNDEYDSLLAVVGNKADKSEVPTKLSDLKIDIEVGGVDEEEVMEIVEENGEEVEAIGIKKVQAEYSIGTSSNYDATNDNQIVTAKAVKSMIDSTITSALEGDY